MPPMGEDPPSGSEGGGGLTMGATTHPGTRHLRKLLWRTGIRTPVSASFASLTMMSSPGYNGAHGSRN